MSTATAYDFVNAQHYIYSFVLKELAQGKKSRPWMWYVFPQIQGLERGEMAQRFALDNLPRAQDYLQHEVLGARLHECAELLLTHPDKSALDIFGEADAVKLHASLTLFALAAEEDSIFTQLLEQFFAGQYDERTLQVLAQLDEIVSAEV